jgi:methyl-accepting chemotaxis protein
MKIGQKLLLGAVALTLVPLAVTAGLLWQGATSLSAQTVDTQVQTQLSSLRDLKVQQLQDEFNTRLAALRALGANRATVEAMGKFKLAFPNAAKEAGKTDDAAGNRQAMLEYVQTQFGAEFAKRNPEAAPELTALVDARDVNTVRLQHDYIVANANKLGEKEKLNAAPGSLSYHALHGQYHPSLEKAQKQFGFYDIFLIDTATDQIVYTVFKELDFGTRLSDGIAAKTKLAEAYYRVKNAKSADELQLSDFAPYLASYNDQAAFAAVPIFEGDKQIGVIAIQYPIDKINAVMSSNKNWAKIGLGATGDAFVVGPDFLMRSEARYGVEQMKAFSDLMADRMDPAAKARMVAKNTSIGLVRIESDATRPAIAGQQGFLRFTDYRGVPSVGAYGPFEVAGLKWGVVAKQNAAEADAPVAALSRETLLRTALVAVAVLLVVGALMALFLRRFMRPINRLYNTVTAVAKGQTSARSQLTQPDEIGELGRAFDNLLDERIAQLEKAQKENETLNNSVIALLQTVFQLSNKDLTVRADVTEDVIGTLSSSINQLSDTTGNALAEVSDIAERVREASEFVSQQAVRVDQTAQGEREALAQMSTNLSRATKQLMQVAQLSSDSNRVAERASTATDGALRAVSATVRGMDDLRESISETEKRFKRLGERSQEISSAVSLINTISERTHMLAMNASMQAATAGEAGRGFAVVAEEVQRLSESSRQATQQIGQLVQNIQLDTNETLYTMNRLISQVVSQSDQAQRAGEQMTMTQETTTQLVQLVKQIAEFSDQQSLLARELQLSVAKLNKGSESTVSAIAEQSRSTGRLVDFSRRLAETVSQFKLPEAARGAT